MRNRKAQGGMEGLIALGIIFMIFIGVYMISNSKNSDLINVNKEIVEREDCFKIANLITSIYNLGESS